MRTSARSLALAPVAVAVAAALAACGPGGSSAVGPPARSSASGTSGTSPARTASPPVPAAGTPASRTLPVPPGPLDGPMPAGFAATSVTFVSADEAFVLGTAPCAHAPCTSVAATYNRGATWFDLPAPAAPLGDPYVYSGQSAIWGIRFASPEHGFVFGNGLWVTTDGGQRWSATKGPGGSIADLEVIDGQVLALSYVCSPQFGCPQTGTLYRRALSGGPWSTVTRVSGAQAIATQAREAAVLDGGRVLVTGNGGLTVATRPTPCDTQATAASAVAVTGPGSLALLCMGGAAAGSASKPVYVSDNLGVTWTRASSPPLAGDPAEISAGTPAQLTVAAASGASWLYHSTDGGARWTVAFKAINAGSGFNDLGFTTTTDGVVVVGPVYRAGNPYQKAGRLLLTSDGGASWTTVRF